MSSVGFLANLSQNIALIWWLLIIRVTGVVFEQAIPIKMLLPILSSSKGQSDLAMNEQEILAVIRTLLALERNYLAVERTQLAQLRTGLTLGLIGPPATAAFAYVYILLPDAFYLDWVASSFFIILTIAGVWMSYRAYVGLKVTRKMQKKIRMRELEVSGKSEAISAVMHDIIGQERNE